MYQSLYHSQQIHDSSLYLANKAQTKIMNSFWYYEETGLGASDLNSQNLGQIQNLKLPEAGRRRPVRKEEKKMEDVTSGQTEDATGEVMTDVTSKQTEDVTNEGRTVVSTGVMETVAIIENVESAIGENE